MVTATTMDTAMAPRPRVRSSSRRRPSSSRRRRAGSRDHDHHQDEPEPDGKAVRRPRISRAGSKTVTTAPRQDGFAGIGVGRSRRNGGSDHSPIRPAPATRRASASRYAEALDAMRCAGAARCPRLPGCPAHRTAGDAVKDQRDRPMFDEIFDAFFSLVRGRPRRRIGRWHSHAHDDLVDDRRTRVASLCPRSQSQLPAGRSQPRQAQGHPGLLRRQGHGRAVQPAPGGEQGRPGRAVRRDRSPKRRRDPTRTSTASSCPPIDCRARALRATSRGRVGPTSTRNSPSPNRTRYWAGSTNWKIWRTRAMKRMPQRCVGG